METVRKIQNVPKNANTCYEGKASPYVLSNYRVKRQTLRLPRGVLNRVT